MKSKYLILLLLIVHALSDIKYKNDIIHENAEFGKVCRTKDGKNLILSKVLNTAKTLVSKLDEMGNYVYHNAEVDIGYSGNAQVMEAKTVNGEDGYTFYHKSLGKEYLTELKDQGQKVQTKEFSTYQEQVSAFTLANGKIFFTGIANPPSTYARTAINLRIFDPQSNTELSGQTLQAYSKYISCYEQKDNEVYCVYVYDEDPLRSLLGIQHFQVNEAGIVSKGEPYLIKAFYTQFNFVKTIKFNDDEVIVLFQTGTGNQNLANVPLGDSGKDLYYYHLKVTPNSMTVVRYDYMASNCRFSSDAEDNTADMIVLEKSVMVICEVENEGKNYAKAFKAYNITNDIKKIDYIDFNQFSNGVGVKNPLFVKFDHYLAILYTYLITESKKNVNLLIMNYPDCNYVEGDVKYFGICPNGKQTKLLSKHIDTFLVNPYPTSMQSVKVYFRIVTLNNMVINNGNVTLELNKDYDPSVMNDLYIKEYNNEEKSFLEYTATRKDPDYDVVFGRTCKIDVEYPQCLDQCYGCDERGTDDLHHCFDCKPGFYGVVKGKDTTGCGTNSSIYNCLKCDIACEQCHGPYLDNVPTTNCKEHYCNYEDNYFPFEDDYRTCFNASDKKKWEELLKLDQVLFLDKSKSNNKRDWVWRKCHKNCAECGSLGDNKNNNCTICKNDLFFYCNQTKTNGGIPGTCHSTCEGNGCYKSDPNVTEGMTKMCPCLPNCKTCQNAELCDICRPTWLLPPERTSCNKSCDYCLTPYWEDEAKQENGRCINCKEEFSPAQYTYQNKCYTEANRPRFNYTEYGSENKTYTVQKLYHVIDEKCNLLTGCKKGCNKCSVLETDRCTECEEGYYKEDPFNVTRKTFKCFAKKVCQGIEQYPHDPELRIGRVPIEENDELVCLNCKQRNNSYRLPEDQYYCGEKINRTYVDIPDDNKLSYCYVRCKSCDKWGISCTQNCLACRDSKYYDLVRYDKTHGNCYRKQHKCGIYPYYHNYELAINEDDCGEDCDVCLYNFQCPKEFPYFKYETHECVEFCPVTDVLGGTCNVNSSAAAIILMKNPFGLRSPYDLLNNTISLNQIISSSLFQYFCASYNCDVNSISKDLSKYFGNGIVYNLPEPKVIIGNNISIELTSVKLELEKIANYLKGDSSTDSSSEKENENKTTGIDLSECEKVLKAKYGLPEEEDLIILKADIMKEFNISSILPEFPDVEYQLFSTSLGAFLPLSVCQQENTDVQVSNPFSAYNLLSMFQSKTAAAVANGYDVFDAYSSFYNDICTPFTNENGNDVLLDARRKDYYNENVNLCNTGCTFAGYNATGKTYTCRCNIISPGEEASEYEGEIIERTMPENFRDLISRRSNIDVFKCSSQAFSAEGQKKNIGSYILLVGLASLIGVAVFHFLKERSGMEDLYNNLYNQLKKVKQNDIKGSDNVTIPPNPPKIGESEEKSEKKNNKSEKKEKRKKKNTNDKKDKKDKKEKIKGTEGISDGYRTGKNFTHHMAKEKVIKDIAYEDDQLNLSPFDDIKHLDKRSFLATYWSFLKFKQTIIFTFYTKSDGILRSTKIALFITFVAFYMAFTALFFNDSIMRAIYIYKGSPGAAVHIPNIVLSSLCSFIASLIVRFVCLGERDISKITSEKNMDKRKSLAELAKKKGIIKIYALYIISALLIGICWYYVSAFIAVFKNSQGHYLINTLVSFIICILWPALTSLIPTFMRRKAIASDSATLYKASQIVSIF